MPQVVLTLPADLIGGRILLAAALSLFHGDVEVVVLLRGAATPTVENAEALRGLSQDLVGEAPLPDIVLLGEEEAAELQPILTAQASDDPMLEAKAVILLAGLAMALWERQTDALPQPAPDMTPPLLSQLAAQRDALMVQRDARITAFTESRRPPRGENHPVT